MVEQWTETQDLGGQDYRVSRTSKKAKIDKGDVSLVIFGMPILSAKRHLAQIAQMMPRPESESQCGGWGSEPADHYRQSDAGPTAGEQAVAAVTQEPAGATGGG